MRALKAVAALLVCLLSVSPALAAESARRVPTVDDLLNIRSAGGAQVSPDGSRVAYTVTAADFKQDAFVTQIWLANALTGETTQLTRGEKSSTSPRWSPDGQWLAFLSSRAGDKNQVFAIRIAGGEAAQLSKSETALSSFSWSPDGARLAFAATKNPDLIQGVTSDIYVLTLEGDAVRKIVSQPGPDTGPRWSPDGKQIAFESAMGEMRSFARNSRIALVSAEGGLVRSLTDAFDEDPGLIDWIGGSIYFAAAQKTAGHLFRLDPTGACRSPTPTSCGRRSRTAACRFRWSCTRASATASRSPSPSAPS